jgi:hypothetical protein
MFLGGYLFWACWNTDCFSRGRLARNTAMTRITTALTLLLSAVALPACADIESLDLDDTEMGEIEDEDFDAELGFEDSEVPETPEEPAAAPVPLAPGAFCGDGEVEGNEECDDGSQNLDSGACTEGCTMNVCGDGLVFEGAEECDNGDLNGVAGGDCSAECTYYV